MQIHLIGIRDSPDHRSVRNPGGGGGGAAPERGGGGPRHMKWVGMMLLRNFELNP